MALQTKDKGRELDQSDDGGFGLDPLDDRRSREQETRAASEEGYEEWEETWNPSKGMLDTQNIPARPGMVQRWVRTKMNGVDDPNNAMKRMNQGWRPRKRSTVPAGVYTPTTKFQDTDVIGLDGIVLMERPKRLDERHADHNREMTRRQMQAVENQLMQVHEPGKGFGAPRLAADSEVSTGRRPAPVADD